MKKITLTLGFLFSLLVSVMCQSSLNFEFQAYPTGLIPGLRYEYQLNDESKLLLRAGYNWIRHRDLGVHDDERGDGFGFTLGYTKRISNFDLSLKNDFWWNSIDWENDVTAPNMTSGNTKITVIQPTIEAAYLVTEKFRPTLAFGYEWNAKTEGEETGQGPILLVGLIYRLF